MKKKKLLKKLQAFFDLDERRKKAHIADLFKILKKLKAKERKIAAELEQESAPDKCKVLQQELEIIYAQRKKGIHVIKELIDSDNLKKD